MRPVLLIVGLMVASYISAQEKKNDVSGENAACVDTVNVDTLDLSPEFEQIPLSGYSRVEESGADKYAIVYINGVCGLYDLVNQRNVTEIKYTTIRLRNRSDSELGPICVFVFTEGDSKGLLSISEANNETMSVYL